MTAERSVEHTLIKYAGDLTATDAWQRLLSEPDSVLVDVRSPQEWQLIGEPNLDEAHKKPVKLSWKLPPEWLPNPSFMQTFKEQRIPTDAPVFFLCKSGGRSLDAACEATRHGWKHCYNIVGGFEGCGPASTEETKGWKASGLAWRHA